MAAEVDLATTAIHVELADSAGVQATELEELNLGTNEAPRPILITSLLPQPFRQGLVSLLQSFRDVFTWTQTDLPRF